MLARIRFVWQTTLMAFLFTTLAMTDIAEPARAEDSDNNPWVVMDLPTKGARARILHRPERPFVNSRPTFVITHGLGGTEAGDRFHQLADAICEAIPGSNVLMVDWSQDSIRKTQMLRLPVPWTVAWNIDAVGKEATGLLKALQVDPARTTFIGESFGNCVNARIAEQSGRRGRILAFNPANLAGGYLTPDLRACAELSWSFQTYSAFDTLESIAHAGFYLETSAGATDKDQHTAGVPWLADRVWSGDLTWLLMQHRSLKQRADRFDATATLTGELSEQRIPRKRPELSENSELQTGQVATV